MRLTYDATTDVAYLVLRDVRPGERLGPTLLLESDRDFPGAVALDFSEEDGRAVGVEFQLASACLPAPLLATAARTAGRSVAARFQERIAPRLATAGDEPAPGRSIGQHGGGDA